MKANQAVRLGFVNMGTPPLPFSLLHLWSISENLILKWGLPRYTDIIFRQCKLSSMTVYVQLNQDKLNYFKRGWELAKRMLKSERVTFESDGIETAYINSNWLIRQRASRQQNVHLEREEMIKEAVSRKSLVENGNIMEELCCTLFSFDTKSLSRTTVQDALVWSGSVRSIWSLSSTPRQLI